MYTTTIEAEKSAMELVSRLGRHGAGSVMVDYTAGRPSGVKFQIDTEQGRQAYRLPVDVSAMEKHLDGLYHSGHVQRRYAAPEQAERVAWRVMRNWLEAQLSMVEAGQTVLAQTMLPFMLVSGTETVYDRFIGTGLRELEPGRD